MKVDVYPSAIKGELQAPGSKSIAQRAVACALLANGESTLSFFPNSEDCEAAIRVAQSLGAVITRSGDTVTIRGGFPENSSAAIRNPKSSIQCGESGLASRMFTPIAALYDGAISVQGEKSLLTRPFDEFIKVLPQLGVEVESTDGRLPMVVKGPLQGGKADMDGSLSSQFITGVLLAATKAPKNTVIKVKDAKSTPYLDLTIEVADYFGVEIKHKSYQEFTVKGNQEFKPRQFAIEGDWSGAAFLFVAAAIAADEGILIKGLSLDFTQADAAILDLIKEVGVTVRKMKNGYWVQRNTIEAFDFDATHCPDLFPPLVALAAYANGVCTIKGASRLVHKESNRAKVLADEFAKANIRIVTRGDEMKIYPGHIRPCTISAHGDHRIAMAAAVLALSGDKISITGAECVSKSYAQFFDHLASLGVKLRR